MARGFGRGDKSQLFPEFTGKRVEGLFAGLDLAARLHEPGGVTLADEQHAPARVGQQGGCDADSPETLAQDRFLSD
jgi:hypothetical protein